MPYFAYFKPYDYPILQFPVFFKRFILHISEQKSCQVKVEKCSTQNYSSCFSATPPSHPTTSNYRFFIGFSVWIIFIKIYIYSVDSCNSCSFKKSFICFSCFIQIYLIRIIRLIRVRIKIFNQNPNQNALDYLA